jgi:hypothetical protein
MVTYSLGAGSVAATPIPGSVAFGAYPGRLLGVTITATGTGTTTFYDNATTNSGTILAAVLGTGTNAIGTFIPIGLGTQQNRYGMPYFNGITINQASTSPGITVLYSPGVPADGRPAM